MKKKTYKQPQIKSIVVEDEDIICTSQFPDSQNESYDEEEETVTDGWFILNKK